MKLKNIKLFMASIILAGVSFNANAIALTGTGYIGMGEIDYWGIDTTGSGLNDLTIDVWANGYFGTHLDSEIFLFEASSGVLIGANDDCYAESLSVSCAEGATDGSTSGLDSFLQVNDLAEGLYILAIGAFNLTEDEVRLGYNSGNEGYGFYQLTVTLEAASVPAPTALLLMATGLIGIGVSNRRKVLG